MKVVRWSFSLVVLSLLLAACRAPATPATSSSGQLLTPVSFVRSGGFAGQTNQVQIEVDGSTIVTRNDGSTETGQLTPSQTQELASLLAGSGLFDADHSFETPGADQFVYTITYNGHMVTAIDGAIPEELAGVIDFLAALL
ncbi:MAG: hypothetical protein K1X65_14040 [Caldilineales bacterium]|nr:hypothetical protein [Caldilineales bacterium]